MATHENTSDEERRTRRSIYAALTANLLIAISKFVAGFISGSAALLAEGAHSVADTINQVFLLISLPLSKSGPDSEHPYGHGQDRFFWTLLVAVGLFVAGAVFSVYEGVTKITGSESGEHGSYLIGYIVLGVPAHRERHDVSELHGHPRGEARDPGAGAAALRVAAGRGGDRRLAR